VYVYASVYMYEFMLVTSVFISELYIALIQHVIVLYSRSTIRKKFALRKRPFLLEYSISESISSLSFQKTQFGDKCYK
jgi:hypothetical protein